MKDDCFANNKPTAPYCKALKRAFCRYNEACVFYKTKEQNKADVESAEAYNEKRGIKYPQSV